MNYLQVHQLGHSLFDRTGIAFFGLEGLDDFTLCGALRD
jgi:hypothetical protein